MTDDAPKSCCRPSTTTPPVATSFPVAEFDEGLRARFLDEEAARRAVERSARRGKVQMLVDRYSLADLLCDVFDAVDRRWKEQPAEQAKQRHTVCVKLRDLATLADRYGM